ncbi:unnamed protein product [Urochloa humidicola]
MAASATIKDTYFHPQHMLASYNYSDLSTHTCAACERVVTGAGYSCDECDFNIHKACFTMPRTVSFANHSREHELTLTRITGSRFCDVCKETSHAGSYMYLDLHAVRLRPAPAVRADEDAGADRRRPRPPGRPAE